MQKTPQTPISPNFATLSFEDRCKNVLMIGPIGSGMEGYGILPMLSQDCKDSSISTIVISPNNKMPQLAAVMAKSLGRGYLYFDPIMDNCASFNPLVGPEADVIEDVVEVFRVHFRAFPSYFKDVYEQLLRNGIKVLKRLDKDKGADGYYATFVWLSRLLRNNGGQGRELVQKFSKVMAPTANEAVENADIANWFLCEYFREFSKMYENSCGLRSVLERISANSYLRHVLNPNIECGEHSEIDFINNLKKADFVCVSTAGAALRELSPIIGHLLLLRLQSAILKHPELKVSVHVIDAPQLFTPIMMPMLGAPNAAIHLYVSSLSGFAVGLGSNTGKQFVDQVAVSAQNVAIFPGGTVRDVKQLGSILALPESASADSVVYQPFGSAMCRFMRGGQPCPPQFIDAEDLSPLGKKALENLRNQARKEFAPHKL